MKHLSQGLNLLHSIGTVTVTDDDVAMFVASLDGSDERMARVFEIARILADVADTVQQDLTSLQKSYQADAEKLGDKDSVGRDLYLSAYDTHVDESRMAEAWLAVFDLMQRDKRYVAERALMIQIHKESGLTEDQYYTLIKNT